jgi:hypothetical protein
MSISPADRSGKNHSTGTTANNTLLDCALEYLRRGCSVIPTKGKKAACAWKAFQQRRPTGAELKGLFALRGVDGLAVIHGAVSGNLVCRDFDSMASYEAWAKAYPWYAERLPRATTARGMHVWFQHGSDGFVELADGEYRGDSAHYTLLPPSRHPDGITYTWVIRPSNDGIPVIDPVEAGLLPPETDLAKTLNERLVIAEALKEQSVNGDTQWAQSTQSTQRAQRPQIAQHTQHTQSLEFSKSSVYQSWDEPTRKAIENAISTTQPTAVGQRHRAVFRFCRELKAIPALANTDPATLRPIVAEWHRRALLTIATKEFSETWGDFLDGWKRVKSPMGQGQIDDAYRRACAEVQRGNPARKAAQLYPTEPKMVLLATLCRELAATEHGGQEFFLDCRTAGRLLEVSHTRALKVLRVLCADRVLELVETGTHVTHQANTYRYVGIIKPRRPPR